MRLLISFIALLLSVFLLQLSSGGISPLDALAGIQQGFSTTQVGLLGSAHYLGFFVGCWWAPRLMGGIGYSRAFAAFAAAGAIGILAHTLITDPYAWAAMRILSGLSVAGCYTIIEAWLHSRVTNDNRGRTMGAYRMVDLSGSLLAQLMIGVLDPASYVSYNLLAILCCASLLPLTLTHTPQPETPPAPRLRPSLALQLSPLGVAGVVVAGLSGAAFRMVGPLYGQQVGLQVQQIALFLAFYVVGGALGQYPVGWLADKYDRRWVLLWLSFASIIASLVTAFMSSQGQVAVFASVIFFGMTTYPIFSVATAHANDYASHTQMVELSAALLFFYAIGGIASPLLTSSLIQYSGPAALFAFIAAAHLLLIVFGLLRMRVRAPAKIRRRYIYIPRTSFIFGRLLRRRNGKHKGESL